MSLWIETPHQKYFCSVAYLRGAWHAQSCRPMQNPYRPGPNLAQYNYGYANEQAGYHDDMDLPFEILKSTDDSHEFYRATKYVRKGQS